MYFTGREGGRKQEKKSGRPPPVWVMFALNLDYNDKNLKITTSKNKVRNFQVIKRGGKIIKNQKDKRAKITRKRKESNMKTKNYTELSPNGSVINAKTFIPTD